jgi:Tfp pilus assembly protein PilN
MKEMNLIPEDILFLVRWNRKRVISTVFFCLLLAIALSWAGLEALSGYYDRKTRNDMKIYSELKQKQIENEKLLKNLSRISGESGKLKNAANAIDAFRRNRVSWADIIGEITEGDLKGMWFREFRVFKPKGKGGKVIAIEGVTKNSGSISNLMSYLEGSGRFSAVRLERGKAVLMEKTPVYSFTLNCEVVK